MSDCAALTLALQRQMLGHPYLHATYCYALFFCMGVCTGYILGLGLGAAIDRWRKSIAVRLEAKP